MGVDVNAMSIYGIRIAWDDDLNEEYERNYDAPGNPHILQDGMCAEYMILGPVLFDSGSHRSGFDGHDCTQILPRAAEELWKEWKGAFRERYSRFSGYLDEAPSFITLMHYS